MRPHTVDHDGALDLAVIAIDFPLDPEERASLHAHLDTCPACTRRTLEFQAEARAIERLPDLSTPDRVRQRLEREVRGSQARRPPGLLAAGAGTALALTVLAVAFFGLPSERPGAGGPGSPLVTNPPASVETGSPTTSSASPQPTSPRPSASPATPSAPSGRVQWSPAVVRTDSVVRTVRGLGVGHGLALASLADAGEDPVLWSSEDGHAWRDAEIPTGVFGGVAPYLVKPYDGGFVALGWEAPSEAGRRIWLSENGLAWQPDLDHSGSLGPLVNGLLAARAGTILVGGRRNDQTIWWTSPDGSAWTQRPVSRAFEGARIADVVSSDDAFYAFGDRAGAPVLLRSADGEGWAATPVPRDAAGITGLVTSTDGFVIYGPSRESAGVPDSIWWSAAGEQWQRAIVNPPRGDARIFRVVATSNGLVAVWQGGDDPVVVTGSDDGRSWYPLESSGFPDGLTVAEVGAIDSALVVLGHLDGEVVAFSGDLAR
jgi:hypothetical protein